MLIAGRHSLVRGNSLGSRERRASGPGWRLCWPRDSSAPRSISGDADYVGQGEITCDSTCIYDVPYRPSRPLLRGHIISQLTDGTLLSRLRLQSPKLAQSHGRQIHCIGTRLEANPNGWFWSKIKPALRILKGKRSAQLLTKARILLKADVSDAGEGWSDSRIAAALDISIATVERTRRQLVEEGFEAVLRRKYNPNSARPRIFDGAAEAKLIALTLSPAPEGFARWSLRLLEEKVVELHIVERASDNTIGRTLKKTFSNPTSSSNG